MTRDERVDVRAILADPDLRRKLMVRTIQATQAREGIETTEEQAERAYYVVTEGERATFFDLERFRAAKGGNGDRRHEMFVMALAGEDDRVRYRVPRREFNTLKTSPLAYRRISIVARLFRDHPTTENLAEAHQGVITGSDEPFLRYFWEVAPRSADRPWIALHKGGNFCRFHFDADLVIDWTDAAQRAFHRLRDPRIYFKPGLTWPRAGGHFSVRWMPSGCVFADKGPAIFPSDTSMTAPLAGVLNSAVAEYIMKGLVSRPSMGARWEVGVVKRLPVPYMTEAQREAIGGRAEAIRERKAGWDRGNELSTQFDQPWLLLPATRREQVSERLRRLAVREAEENARIQQLYAALDDEVYRLYGISDDTRAVIEETLGERPPEVIWPQMERKTAEQKRMEHVWRLLSYAVKRVVEADADGLVPFAPLSGEAGLLDRVHEELAALFPEQDVNQVEVEIANELKRRVKGYRSATGVGEWLENVYFDYHAALYKKRPIVWHVASSQGTAPFAFGALCHYHRFDANRMAKLRAGYLRDAIATFRREAALAGRENRDEDRIELQARLEEAQALDRKLQAVQEGHHEGPEGGDRDYRILTPWKSADERPTGWDPDVDDGVKVNIVPLQKADVLRSMTVV